MAKDDQTLLDIRAANESYLTRFTREYGFDEVLITDQNGLILLLDSANQRNIHVSEVSPALKESYEQAMFGGSFLTDLTREGDQSQRAFMYISSVVLDRVTRRPVGTTIARLPRETSRIMVERAGMGDTGDAFIVGSDDLARSELTFSENQRLGNSDVLNTRIQSRTIRQAFSGVKGVRKN